VRFDLKMVDATLVKLRSLLPELRSRGPLRWFPQKKILVPLLLFLKLQISGAMLLENSSLR